jgi:hypothetical protein
MARASITESGDISEFLLSATLFLNSPIEKSAMLAVNAPSVGFPATRFASMPSIRSAALATVPAPHPAAPAAIAATSSSAI